MVVPLAMNTGQVNHLQHPSSSAPPCHLCTCIWFPHLQRDTPTRSAMQLPACRRPFDDFCAHVACVLRATAQPLLPPGDPLRANSHQAGVGCGTQRMAESRLSNTQIIVPPSTGVRRIVAEAPRGDRTESILPQARVLAPTDTTAACTYTRRLHMSLCVPISMVNRMSVQVPAHFCTHCTNVCTHVDA